jgi:AcrR family transcriptional regulator
MEQIGRREANKRATREAVLEAARRLFADKGYEATSVREIAEDAGVGERTFYRYFDGKEALLDDELQRWIDAVADALRTRPLHEGPLIAVEHTIVALSEAIAATPEQRPEWMFTAAPRPFEVIAGSAPRPLLRFEDAIANALLARDPQAGSSAVQLLARVAVAVIRSAAIQRQELDLHAPGSFGPLVRDAFAQLRAVTGGPDRR